MAGDGVLQTNCLPANPIKNVGVTSCLGGGASAAREYIKARGYPRALKSRTCVARFGSRVRGAASEPRQSLPGRAASRGGESCIMFFLLLVLAGLLSGGFCSPVTKVGWHRSLGNAEATR